MCTGTINPCHAGIKVRSALTLSQPETSVRQGALDAAQLCQPFQPADGGIAGLGPACQVIEDFLAVIGPHRNGVIFTTLRPAARFFGEECGDDGDHIGSAFEVLVFEEGAGDGVRVARHVAQMHEMDAIGKTAGDEGQVVIRPRAEGAGAECHAIGAAVDL